MSSLEHYTIIEEKIGQGAYAHISVAVNPRFDKPVALKRMKISEWSDAGQQLGFKEAAMLQDLDHPNIVKVLDRFQSKGEYFIVLQYCKHGDLDHFYNKYLREKWTFQSLLQFARQIVSAVQFIHSKNIVHRDLKLANILVDENFVIKLADFGFAKMREEQEMLQSHLGTPLTMAPEVIKNQAYDNKADIWSLGVMLYQLAYGRHPYNYKSRQQESMVATLNQILKFPDKASIPESFVGLLKGMLTQAAEARLSIEEVVAVLKGLESEAGPINSLQIRQLVEQAQEQESKADDSEVKFSQTLRAFGFGKVVQVVYNKALCLGVLPYVRLMLLNIERIGLVVDSLQQLQLVKEWQPVRVLLEQLQVKYYQLLFQELVEFDFMGVKASVELSKCRFIAADILGKARAIGKRPVENFFVESLKSMAGMVSCMAVEDQASPNKLKFKMGYEVLSKVLSSLAAYNYVKRVSVKALPYCNERRCEELEEAQESLPFAVAFAEWEGQECEDERVIDNFFFEVVLSSSPRVQEEFVCREELEQLQQALGDRLQFISKNSSTLN